MLTCPLLFSGIVFSTLLSSKGSVSGAMAMNLLGAICGGLLEYNDECFGRVLASTPNCDPAALRQEYVTFRRRNVGACKPMASEKLWRLAHSGYVGHRQIRPVKSARPDADHNSRPVLRIIDFDRR